MPFTLINVCWIMVGGNIGTAYRLDEANQRFITARHLFGDRIVEQALIQCPLNGEDGQEKSYWIHDLGHDVAILSQDLKPRTDFRGFDNTPPSACYHWTLLPEDQWPWSRLNVALDLLTIFQKIKKQTKGMQTQATTYYAQYLLKDYVSEVHNSETFVDSIWSIINQTNPEYGATEYLPSSFTMDGHRLVLMKSVVHSYLQLNGDLWTDCDGWKGASGGVVVDESGRVLAVTTGLGSEASYFLREKSRVGILRHRYLFAGES